MSIPENLMIAIADDHILFREGLSALIDSLKGIEVVVKAENGKALLKKLEQQHSDVVFMDLQMPVMGGIEATANISKRYPKIKIIGLSILNEKKIVIAIIKAGAHGYLDKNCEPEELEKAIHDVASNGVHSNQHMTEALFKEWGNRGPEFQ